MRKYLKICSMALFLLFHFCSDDNSKNPVGSAGYQQAIIFFDKTLESFTDIEIPINPDLININGSISSDVLPEIEYIKLGDTLCTRYFDYKYSLGSSTFKNKQGITIIQDIFAIEVKTRQAIIAGEITLPERLNNFIYPFADSLMKGDSLAVNWEQSDCDFYIIESEYFFTDFEDQTHRFKFDTLMVGNSFIIEGNILSYDGTLFINIYPVNGSFPEKGAVPNIQGGFLYAINRGSRNLITVGNGFSAGLPLTKITDENFADKKDIILSRLFKK